LQLDAQIQIGVARAQAMGAAIANMQIKMFGGGQHLAYDAFC
jgi:chemotaxis receptor (MCP) glutamine deamidase CheD